MIIKVEFSLFDELNFDREDKLGFLIFYIFLFQKFVLNFNERLFWDF